MTSASKVLQTPVRIISFTVFFACSTTLQKLSNQVMGRSALYAFFTIGPASTNHRQSDSVPPSN